MSDQIEFSSFYRLLNSIKEGDSEKISLLNDQIEKIKKGEIAKNHLEELGFLYLMIGIEELYNFTNKKDLESIGLIDKKQWEQLSIDNKEELPIFLSNKMINYIKDHKKAKDISNKWSVREAEVKKHITNMARYITEGLLDVIE